MHDHSLNIGKMRYDDTVKDYEDSLNAVVYRQVPAASDSISVNMGSAVDLYMTLDHSRVPVREVVLDTKEVTEEEL